MPRIVSVKTTPLRSGLKSVKEAHFEWCTPIIHQGDHWWPTGGSVVLLTELSVHLTVHSSPTLLARGQSSSRRGIPDTVRAAVFVLPNSIPFHSPLCALCLFWCSFTPWGLPGPEKENISPTSNPMTRPLEAASSGFLGLGERQRP